MKIESVGVSGNLFSILFALNDDDVCCWILVLDMFWYFEVVTGLNNLKVVFQFEVYVFSVGA